MAYTKLIKQINIKTDFLQASGETRAFEIIGSKNAVVSVEVLNGNGQYYNFSSKTFSATKSKLDKAVLTNGMYRESITFPKVTSPDTYTIQFYAHPDFNTKIYDLINSNGSFSLMHEVEINQFRDLTLTISALSINSLTGFGSSLITSDNVSISRGKSIGKRPFKVVVTAAATRNLSIKRQPKPSDFTAFVTRTVGSASIPIRNEDVSSSTFYKWPIDNVAGLRKGMIPDPAGTNITAGTIIDNYIEVFDSPEIGGVRSYKTRSTTRTSVEDATYNRLRPNREQIQEILKISKETTTAALDSRYDLPTRITREQTIEDRITEDLIPGNEEEGLIDNTAITKVEVFESAIQTTGEATVSHNITTAQPGVVIFNKQQADALKDDSLKFYAHGFDLIKSLTSYDINVSDLKVELTPVTTTVDGAVNNNVNVTVDERAGIRDGNFSTVTGIGIDTSSAIPTVDSGAGAVSGSGQITLSAAQTLEDGITLTFGKASRIATITGIIDIKSAGNSDTTIFLDVERFLTAV